MIAKVYYIVLCYIESCYFSLNDHFEIMYSFHTVICQYHMPPPFSDASGKQWLQFTFPVLLVCEKVLELINSVIKLKGECSIIFKSSVSVNYIKLSV